MLDGWIAGWLLIVASVGVDYCLGDESPRRAERVGERVCVTLNAMNECGRRKSV